MAALPVIEGFESLAVDAEPGVNVDTVVAPDWIPMVGRVDAGVPEQRGPLPHPLLKLDRKSEQRGERKFQMLQAAMGERDIHGALRLTAVPALAGGHMAEQPSDQATRRAGSSK